uniref:Uncharacterized protein n=1 Tax=Setaria viridis TaxID=4556 RepID=A0A4U6UDA9_SETVI|nr:hypothetical protein SEVIR_5G054866v2 [Setaria viridis]
MLGVRGRAPRRPVPGQELAGAARAGPPLALPQRRRRHRPGGSGHGLQLRGAGTPQPEALPPPHVGEDRRRKAACPGDRGLAVRTLQVAAPALESFGFHGDVVCSSDPDDEDDAAVGVQFGATPALRDAYLSHLGFVDYDDDRHDFSYFNLLECIVHANILTLCSVGLLM